LRVRVSLSGGGSLWRRRIRSGLTHTPASNYCEHVKFPAGYLVENDRKERSVELTRAPGERNRRMEES